ncbi:MULTISPECIES: CidA/LrgA family protein [Tetragenococcus]|uniref:Antiholin-like protein n=3 Tax=Tetragenococcus TaxID=51668 RepID=A0A091BWL2_9ENTE|nr:MULTISPECIES: CidA/LrgA family protein [Tetragenococcus]GMA48180.1 CidA/LrgA family protein [Tetragenococcus muriaticus]AYW47704.1 CidA/LrgA family protein [Tetragenococcus osmophilus]KFN89129.1 antiholin-like protein [Tetragenococcus muriaticus 3MR10-3]KFN89351.1 antiholin-like protein [Tetragenococcus muriaticus PMC-11-5]GMA72686.1 CidA/LrgA family protein [Tetragenococcus osmophilus]
MKYIKQIFWIFLFALAGEVLSLLIPIAIPGSVIGMVLLFFALHFGWLNMERVADVGNFLTGNMAIFFVPAGVGLMAHLDILASIWGRLLCIIVISLITVLTLVGTIVQKAKNKVEKNKAIREVEENA